MSILVWLNPDGSLQQGREIADDLANLIVTGPRCYPNQRRVAYRIRIKEKAAHAA